MHGCAPTRTLHALITHICVRECAPARTQHAYTHMRRCVCRVSTYTHATRVYTHAGARAWVSSYTHATRLHAHLHTCARTHVPLHARYTHSLTHVGAHVRVCSYTHCTRVYAHICRCVCTYVPLHAHCTQIHRPNRKTNRILAVNFTQI